MASSRLFTAVLVAGLMAAASAGPIHSWSDFMKEVEGLRGAIDSAMQEEEGMLEKEMPDLDKLPAEYNHTDTHVDHINGTDVLTNRTIIKHHHHNGLEEEIIEETKQKQGESSAGAHKSVVKIISGKQGGAADHEAVKEMEKLTNALVNREKRAQADNFL